MPHCPVLPLNYFSAMNRSGVAIQLFTRFMSQHCPTLLAAVLTLTLGLSALGGEYRITEVMPLPGTLEAKPTKINDRGEVVGGCMDERNLTHPFVYKNGVSRELFSPGEYG